MIAGALFVGLVIGAVGMLLAVNLSEAWPYILERRERDRQKRRYEASEWAASWQAIDEHRIRFIVKREETQLYIGETRTDTSTFEQEMARGLALAEDRASALNAAELL